MATTRQRILEMDHQGRIAARTLRDIGDELGVSRQRVRQILATSGIVKPPCRGANGRVLAQRVAEQARARWDGVAQVQGFADFAALVLDWGTQQRLAAREISRRLGLCKDGAYAVLRRCGYRPDRYRPRRRSG